VGISHLLAHTQGGGVVVGSDIVRSGVEMETDIKI
jgi:hypothetical protein